MTQLRSSAETEVIRLIEQGVSPRELNLSQLGRETLIAYARQENIAGANMMQPNDAAPNFENADAYLSALPRIK